MRVILFAFVVVLALSGCDTPTDRARAEADRLRGLAASQNAEAVRLASEADLAAVQAISSTLSVQSGQIQQLTSTVIESARESARLWQAATVGAFLFAGALVVLLFIVVIAGLTRRSAPAPVTYVVSGAPAQSPTLIDQPAEWAVMRRERIAAQRREMAARQALLVEGSCRQIVTRR